MTHNIHKYKQNHFNQFNWNDIGPKGTISIYFIFMDMVKESFTRIYPKQSKTKINYASPGMCHNHK